jgi:hypothetical protein
MTGCRNVSASGGVERRARERAVIGVHQVAAITSAGNRAPRDEISVARNISVHCQRYLGDMGVNLQAWLHAAQSRKRRSNAIIKRRVRSCNAAPVRTALAKFAGPAGSFRRRAAPCCRPRQLAAYAAAPLAEGRARSLLPREQPVLVPSCRLLRSAWPPQNFRLR